MRLVPSTPDARRRLLAPGAILTTALLLGACTADPEPAPDPEPTTTAETTTPEPEPEPTETGPAKPERPAAMERDDAEGAAAAAEYFLSLRSYIMVTGDTEEWESLSYESCGYCASGLEQAETIASRGDVFTGGEITTEIVETYLQDSVTGIFPFDLKTDEARTVITDSAGDELFEAESSSQVNRVEVGRQDGDWVIVEVAIAPES
ncbi:DUF6318 family protein [Oerskovia flava]|uniref:DUF6318 family protein n=1 Tax=Oerskovia flava TaxID=2986422 RepID=UPI002240E06F|nr:DUF6318 family protein [Oerskovia sp. JB1-3-2]